MAYWNRRRLEFGAVLDSDQDRVRLRTTRGKTSRIPAGKIEFIVNPAPTAPGSADPEHAVRALAGALESVEGLARACDVRSLWELAREAASPMTTAELAELAYGGGAGAQQAAVVVALLDDGSCFVRKGSTWEARDPEEVERLTRQRENDARLERERERFVRSLQSAADGRPVSSSGTETEDKFLSALLRMAMDELRTEGAARALALEALDASGLRYDRPGEGAFRLLRLFGRIDDDDANLDLLRYEIRTTFPQAVLEAAQRAAKGEVSPEGRDDLRDLDLFSIDSPQTKEIDDALSLERRDGRTVVGVHIADPTTRVPVSGALDEEARFRGVTLYLPDRKILMLPPDVSEDAASLLPGADRPAVSFLVEIDDEGAVSGFDVRPSIVRSARRLSYEEADRTFEGSAGTSSVEAELIDRLLRRERFRREAGAVPILITEVEPRVSGSGDILLDRLPAMSPSRRAITEAMVLVGELAARVFAKQGTPAIHRRQPPPADPLRAVEGECDPVTARRLRRSLRRGEVGLAAGPHYALGLEAYAQVTSPLRRYYDLVNMRQLVAAVDGRTPPHAKQELARIAAMVGRAERDARRIENRADRYWLLRYLQRREGETVSATVLESGRETHVMLDDTRLEQPVRGLPPAEAGDRLTLRIARVNPRADLLSLRP